MKYEQNFASIWQRRYGNYQLIQFSWQLRKMDHDFLILRIVLYHSRYKLNSYLLLDMKHSMNPEVITALGFIDRRVKIGYYLISTGWNNESIH